MNALAQVNDGILGTKAAPLATSAAGGGAGTLVQTLLALAVVAVLLKVLLPRIVRRLGHAVPTGVATLVVEESTTLAGAHLHVVSLRGRTLLLGATATSVSLLADLTTRPEDEPKLFEDVLGEAPEYVPAESLSASAELLDRLDRLNARRS